MSDGDRGFGIPRHRFVQQSPWEHLFLGVWYPSASGGTQRTGALVGPRGASSEAP
jgi:hypothetical protein